MSKINVIESNKGDWRVTGCDGSMGYVATFTYIENVTKAIAKSIARQLNRQVYRQEMKCGCQIDIGFNAEDPYDRDMGDMYGGRDLLLT